ncbi:MAG TPA: GPW/gp25 family protein [Anaerolineae bacterium]|nr:GPW/gp25 family protein [Anaerolineae bacterium]
MNDTRNKAFLGQGWNFPLQLNARGGIALVSGEPDIEQSIQIILGTAPGERRMRPEFGCRINELVFAPNNAETEGLLIHYITEALERWEPRIEVQDILVSTAPDSEATLLAEIQYQIKDTHDPRSIVYPLYLMDEE